MTDFALVSEQGARDDFVGEVERGVKLPGLYPMNEETKARYAAWKTKS